MLRLPNAIGIGAPKAGTTWLFKCLRRHPQVFMAACKETNFFSYGTIEGRLPEYAEHFRGSDGALAIGEISTRYLTSEVAPERINAHLPGARLFVSLRNPVEQVYSHYWHLRRQNFHEWGPSTPPTSLEEAVDRYESRLLGPARYAGHLERWLRHVPPGRLHVILYDDIKRDPGGVLRSLYAHLGIDDSFRPGDAAKAGSDVRRGTSPRGAGFERAHAVVYRTLSVQVYYRLKAILGVRRAVALKDSLRIREGMERVFFRAGYPAMTDATRQFLVQRLFSDIDRVEALTGRSLAAWRSS